MIFLMIKEKLFIQIGKKSLATNDQSEIVQEMIIEFVNEIILECIPAKKI